MAAALLNAVCGDRFVAESAGLEPGELYPPAVAAMRETGIDIAGNATRSVFDVYRSGARFSYVITVCDEASADRCPIFPGTGKRLHWSFPDPAATAGTHEQRLAVTRAIRDQIKARISAWCAASSDRAQ
jgi:arsenate reductase